MARNCCQFTKQAPVHTRKRKCGTRLRLTSARQAKCGTRLRLTSARQAKCWTKGATKAEAGVASSRRSLQPTQALPFSLVGADDLQEAFLQRSFRADVGHAFLMREFAVGDDADVGAELLDDFQDV